MRSSHGREWCRPSAATAWPTAQGLVLRNSSIAQSWMSGGARSDGALVAVRAARRRGTRDREMPRAPHRESMLWWKIRSATVERNRSVVAHSTRPATRSGCWRHTRWAMIDPIE